MRRDFKTGLFSGLVVVIAATLWLATRPALSPKRLYSASSSYQRQSSNLPASVPDSPDIGVLGSRGDSQTKDPNTTDWTIYEQDEKIKTEKFHIVLKSETLSDISYQRYGSAAKWQKIYNANRDVIKNPNAVRPGTKLIIPD